uniref:Uncharacterized protein n=1 Tax=Timema douglasi TaxID=61478 RepID=A0A7R8VY11_TIMDO|nr:unnamed protein product [Timema douglasi]
MWLYFVHPPSWYRKSMWRTDASSSHSVATMLPSHCHVLLILLGISHDTGSRLVRESEGRVGRRQWRARKDGGANTTDNTAQVDTVPERFDLNKEVSPVLDGEGNFVGQAISLLQRLNERLTALQALDEQQIRRLESLEYRLTKIEVQGQEKYEALRTELREVSRRAQQLDWQSSKMDASLEGIKLDTTGLKHGQDQLRGLHGTEHRRRGENNIRMNLKEIGCSEVDWIELAQDKDRM